MRDRSTSLARIAVSGLVATLALTPTTGCGTRAASSQETAPAAVTIDLDPPADRERSPYTGWTRAHYEAVFARTLLGFVEHRSPAGARTRYPGGEKLPAAMEGATRMLPALGAWLACPCNPDRIVVDGRELDVLEIARTIVVTGTDPASPDYWHPSPGGWDQREVEAASVAEFLVRSRARVWDRLTPLEQAQIMAWLAPAEQPLAANWLAFQIARNSARRALGHPVPVAALDEQLDRLWSDHVGDGFFRDGHRDRFDWYDAFVVHPELSFWRSLAPAEDAERAARFARATERFLAHLPYLFDAQGRVAPIGRSLGYRSAVLAGLHASILAGDRFVEPGLARRISAGNLRFHVEAGMFGPGEILTRGYHGEQPGVIEDYLRPGSQYFFTRALSVLALPPEHEFWTATEQPLPADRGDFVHAIPAVGWMLTHDADGAGLILHNAGSASTKRSHYDKYAKLGYPAATWFARSTESSGAYDSLVVSAPGRRRSRPDARAVAPGFAWTRYAIQAQTWISTATLSDPGWVGGASLRLSCIEPGADAPARAYEGSYAIALGSSPRAVARSGERGPWMVLDSGEDPPAWGAGAVLLAGLHGWDRVGREPAEHVLGGPAGYVGLGIEATFDRPRCFASLQALATAPFEPEHVLATAPAISVLETRVQIDDWAGTRAWVELDREPVERTIELGPIRATGPLRLLWTGRANERERVVAVGVRELADERGPLLRSRVDARALVACEFGPETARCELDGPIALRRPTAARELRIRDASATRIELARDTEWIEIAIAPDEVGSVLVEVE